MEMFEGSYSLGPTTPKKKAAPEMTQKPELQTYSELMDGMIICQSDEQFTALTEGKSKVPLGSESHDGYGGGNYSSTNLKKLGCDPEASQKQENFLYPSKYHVSMLYLVLEGKKRKANLMRIVTEQFRDHDKFLIRVEYWQVGPKKGT